MKHGSLKVLCNCNHTFQDQQYGARMRAATPANKSRLKGGPLQEVRCTVCGTAHRAFSEK